MTRRELFGELSRSVLKNVTKAYSEFNNFSNSLSQGVDSQDGLKERKGLLETVKKVDAKFKTRKEG
jgi:hypothetical protein